MRPQTLMTRAMTLVLSEEIDVTKQEQLEAYQRELDQLREELAGMEKRRREIDTRIDEILAATMRSMPYAKDPR